VRNKKCPYVPFSLSHSLLLSIGGQGVINNNGVPNVSYPNLFVPGVSYPAFLKRVRVRHIVLRLGLGLGLVLGLSVVLRIRG